MHHHIERRHGLVTAAAIVGTVAVVQAPVRVAAYALLLRHQRRVTPELFDGTACLTAIATCLDEYQRERLRPPF
jgi:hypothetical protein